MIGARARILSGERASEYRRFAVRPGALLGAAFSYAVGYPDYIAGSLLDLPYLGAAASAPPVIVEVLPERSLLLRGGTIVEAKGEWDVYGEQDDDEGSNVDGEVRSGREEGSSRQQGDARPGLRFSGRFPLSAARLLVESAEAAIGFVTPLGTVALPGWWDGGRWRASALATALEVSGIRLPAPTAVTVDLSTGSRPTELRGVMLRGTARAVERSGMWVVLSLNADRVTWWRGLSSTTASLESR